MGIQGKYIVNVERKSFPPCHTVCGLDFWQNFACFAPEYLF